MDATFYSFIENYIKCSLSPYYFFLPYKDNKGEHVKYESALQRSILVGNGLVYFVRENKDILHCPFPDIRRAPMHPVCGCYVKRQKNIAYL